jgi:hypothetical protein|tara:strand:+ start:1598 stop:1825 length:228 start_codon:yes stop_codon:yes gene_type:complete
MLDSSNGKHTETITEADIAQLLKVNTLAANQLKAIAQERIIKELKAEIQELKSGSVDIESADTITKLDPVKAKKG